MTNNLHNSAQETDSGDGMDSPQPDLSIQNFIISVTQISIKTLGSVNFKVQHSDDGSTWFDVPNLSSGSISVIGTTTISLSPNFSALGHQRVVWTFNNANSITFSAFLTGL